MLAKFIIVIVMIIVAVAITIHALRGNGGNWILGM